MNQETIPDNNLPVYLQQYDVKIFDDKKESVGTFYIPLLVPYLPIKKKNVYGP